MKEVMNWHNFYNYDLTNKNRKEKKILFKRNNVPNVKSPKTKLNSACEQILILIVKIFLLQLFINEDKNSI